MFSYHQTNTSYNEKQLDTYNVSDDPHSDTIDPNSNDSSTASLIPKISAHELNLMINSPDALTIIDVRAREHYDNGHIKSSYHIDDTNTNIIADTVILITQNGNEDLIISLYRDFAVTKTVMHLEGGVNAWSNSGFNLIASNPVPDFSSSSKVHFIEPRNFDAIIRTPDTITSTIVIDTRRPGNFENGHVAHAINIPLAELEHRYKEISYTSKVLIYGANEESSFQSGLLLYELGIFNTSTMRGGFDAWTKYNYEVVN